MFSSFERNESNEAQDYFCSRLFTSVHGGNSFAHKHRNVALPSRNTLRPSKGRSSACQHPNLNPNPNQCCDRIGAAGTESRVHLQIFARMLSRKGLIAVLSVRFRKPSDQLCSAVQCSAVRVPPPTSRPVHVNAVHRVRLTACDFARARTIRTLLNPQQWTDSTVC